MRSEFRYIPGNHEIEAGEEIEITKLDPTWNMQKYTIESGVPVIPRHTGLLSEESKQIRSTMEALKLHESFEVAVTDTKSRNKLQAVVGTHGRKLKNKIFVCRKTDKGFRVWLLEEKTDEANVE